MKPVFKTAAACVLAIVILGFILESRSTRIVSSTAKEKLASLAYLEKIPAKPDGKTGVVTYDPAKACRGLNIHTNMSGTQCLLTDMHGKTVHSWSTGRPNLRHAWLRPDGSLIGLFEMESIACLDWYSQVQWSTKMKFHHDIAFTADRGIYALAAKPRIVFKSGIPFPVLDDDIVLLSADGSVKEEISVYGLLKNEISLSALMNIYRKMFLGIPPTVGRQELCSRGLPPNYSTPRDILHTNSLKLIPGDIPGICKKGNLLISMASLNLIAIVDHNKIQSSGQVEEIMNLAPLPAKWESFGWTAVEVDGHDLGQLIGALEKAKANTAPTVVIAHTIKGKGVSFMENRFEWHSRPLKPEEAEEALAQLERGIKHYER